MTNTHKLFLDILQTALSGDKLIETEEMKSLSMDDWQGILQIAQTHKVLPMVCETIYQLPCLQTPEASFLASTKKLMIQQVMMQTMKTVDFLQLNKALQAAGCKPLVVKGIICCNLYPKPDYRLSGDEDVLIAPSEFSKCHKVMTDFGMLITDKVMVDHEKACDDKGQQLEISDATLMDEYEVAYRKKDSPLYIELHKSLFPVEESVYSAWNFFFEGAHERAVEVNVHGEIVYSLSYTDHLFYLICHAFKHFLHSGFGIRQVCDIVMFTNAYGSQVDWQRVVDNCLQIRAHVFAAAVFQIGEKYLNFDSGQACYPDALKEISVDASNMLEDLLCGGIYGSSDMSRKHSSNITLNAVSTSKSGFMAVLKTIFPPAKSLTGRYPYLQKKPYLLPAAWVNRIFTYAKETTTDKNNSATEAVKIGNQRIALLKEYGVID